MGTVFLLVFFALFHPVLLYTPAKDERFSGNFPPFNCGNHGAIQGHSTNTTRPTNCGPFEVTGCDEEFHKIQVVKGAGRWYDVESISQVKFSFVKDRELPMHLNASLCESFNNLSLPILLNASSQIISNLNLFKCKHTVNVTLQLDLGYTGCRKVSIYYAKNGNKTSLPPDCSNVQLPANKNESYDDIVGLLTAKFSLERQLLEGRKCQYNSEGKCQCREVPDMRPPPNHVPNLKARKVEEKQRGSKALIVGLALGLGCPAAVLIILLPILIIRHRYKKKYASSNLLSMKNSSDKSSKSDLERGNIFLGVHVFSYSELEEATNNFDSKRELGDGGFGIVYHGKLRDRREVAVKRLYNHNYRRFEQFMNEIEILACLHHRNLVSLYGCTSRHSRELLLVYEYIPNGTVADHLQHDQAKKGPLTWPLRMRIAIETASALAYLHASDIIHRDVKTNNILLDKNFCVKVADFGLSRLFPSDVTHVSTFPQGTPGYIDPEYHQCYQLTAKSDVYSFGVFLIELISSMPAVDINRHQHEINLADLAIKKIQKCAFDELIDPCLGYKSDEEVKRMTTLVAKLAFRCLQQDNKTRPSMIDVLEELKGIESGELENLEEEHVDDAVLKSGAAPPSVPDCNEQLISR